jgi:hypothetical protein
MRGDAYRPISIDGLAHHPLRVTNCRWIPKVVTTDPPKYIPHAEFSCTCDLEADVPLLPALILEDGRSLSYARPGRRSLRQTLTISLTFQPFDWNTSDCVTISLSSMQSDEVCALALLACNPALKHDPRPYVTMRVEEGERISAGSSFCIATVNAGTTIAADLVAVAADDTESCRCGRWRIRKRLLVELPLTLSFLRTGRRAGRFRSPFDRA